MEGTLFFGKLGHFKKGGHILESKETENIFRSFGIWKTFWKVKIICFFAKLGGYF